MSFDPHGYGVVSFATQVRAHIFKARRDKGLSQVALAELVGVGQSHISQIESGDRDPSLELLGKIAEVLAVKFLPHTRRMSGGEAKLVSEVACALRHPDAFFPEKRERLARWAERGFRALPPPIQPSGAVAAPEGEEDGK